MRKRRSIVLVLLVSCALAWGCKVESKQQAPQSKSNLEKQQIAGQSGVSPAGEIPKQTTRASEKPKIFFEQTEYDFGKLDQGTKVEHLFLFKNTGNAPLLVNKVRSS